MLYYFLGEFGVVYRATLGSQGRFGREVAVKTLKGRNTGVRLPLFLTLCDVESQGL